MTFDPCRRALLAGMAGTMALAGWTSALRAQVQSQPQPQFRIVSHDPRFDRLVAPGTALETIAEIPGMRGEGPLWRKDALWISDMLASRVIEVRLDGKTRTLAENAGGVPNRAIPTVQGPNGMANWHDGAVLLCRSGWRDIGILKRDGSIFAFIPDFNGKRFNSPNDIAVHRDGSVWFTDPPLSLPGHPLARSAYPNDPPRAVPYPLDQQIPFNGVYRWKAGKIEAIITDMIAPNGIAFSPDGRTVYVNNALPDMYARAYRVARDGSLSHGREIFRFPPGTPQDRGLPDGLKTDIHGNLWMSGPHGIYVIAPSGKLLGQILLPSRSTNLAFGDDGASLFIVSNPHVLRIRTRTKGNFTRLGNPSLGHQ